ncbi:MAG: hypothetical protein VCD00_09295 [Candidatus Hydrogenedentota bacterium]
MMNILRMAVGAIKWLAFLALHPGAIPGALRYIRHFLAATKHQNDASHAKAIESYKKAITALPKSLSQRLEPEMIRLISEEYQAMGNKQMANKFAKRYKTAASKPGEAFSIFRG